MSKDPAFLFYPNDWLGGTMGMSFEEKGAYMELLMMQFNRGHMTKHMIGQTVGQLWDNIKDKFEIDKDGKFFNRRLEEEKERRKSYTQSRKNNVLGKNQYSKDKKDSGHMTSHMENENENENINKDIKKREHNFLIEVMNFQNEYEKEILNNFYLYWTEKKPKGKKMRFEMEKVFDIERRLNTWKRNEKSTNINGKTTSLAEKLKQRQ